MARSPFRLFVGYTVLLSFELLCLCSFCHFALLVPDPTFFLGFGSFLFYIRRSSGLLFFLLAISCP
jgi:hypothetical protein